MWLGAARAVFELSVYVDNYTCNLQYDQLFESRFINHYILWIMLFDVFEIKLKM